MPDYKVTTDKGVFKVTLDKPPASDAELQQLVEEQLSGQSGATKPETKIEQGPSLARRAAMAPFEFMVPPGMRESSIGKMIANTGASSLLPMIGEAAGAASPIPGGAMAGSGLGEAANQLLGITEPSKTQIGIATAAPGVGKLIGKGAEIGSNWLAKTFAGRDIMSEAAERLLKKWMGPKVSADELYAQARQLTQQVQPSETANTVGKLVDAEVKRIPGKVNKAILEELKPIKEFFQQGAEIPAPEMMVESQRLRAMASQAYKDPSTVQLGIALDDIRGAMLSDLEKSGSSVVKEAAKAYRKESALDRLSELMGQNQPLQRIHNLMKKSSLFKGAFSPEEIDQIERIARKMGSVPASGGHGVMGKIMTGGAGFEMGGVPGMALGLIGPAAMRKLLESPFARNYTERILSGATTVTPEIAAALSTFATGLMAKAPQPQQAAQ